MNHPNTTDCALVCQQDVAFLCKANSEAISKCLLYKFARSKIDPTIHKVVRHDKGNAIGHIVFSRRMKLSVISILKLKGTLHALDPYLRNYPGFRDVAEPVDAGGFEGRVGGEAGGAGGAGRRGRG